MLGQRLRRWPSIKTTLLQRVGCLLILLIRKTTSVYYVRSNDVAILELKRAILSLVLGDAMSIIILSMLDLFQLLKTVVLTPLNLCFSNVVIFIMLNTDVLFSSTTFGY